MGSSPAGRAVASRSHVRSYENDTVTWSGILKTFSTQKDRSQAAVDELPDRNALSPDVPIVLGVVLLLDSLRAKDYGAARAALTTYQGLPWETQFYRVGPWSRTRISGRDVEPNALSKRQRVEWVEEFTG